MVGISPVINEASPILLTNVGLVTDKNEKKSPSLESSGGNLVTILFIFSERKIERSLRSSAFLDR